MKCPTCSSELTMHCCPECCLHCGQCGTRGRTDLTGEVTWYVPTQAKSHAAIRARLQEEVDSATCICSLLPMVGAKPPCPRCEGVVALALDTPEART